MPPAQGSPMFNAGGNSSKVLMNEQLGTEVKSAVTATPAMLAPDGRAADLPARPSTRATSSLVVCERPAMGSRSTHRAYLGQTLATIGWRNGYNGRAMAWSRKAAAALPHGPFGILLVALVLGLPGMARAADEAAATDTVVISETARRYFASGVRLLKDPDGARYEEAYRAFKAAFDDSSSPQILGNLGLCAMKLERDGEAIEAYRRYLAEVERIDPAERSQIESDLTVLTSNVVELELRIEPAGSTVTDERAPVRGPKVVNRYRPTQGTLKLGVRAGHHRFTLQHEGYEMAVWSVELVPGQRLTNEITLEPSRPAPPEPVAPKPPAKPAAKPGPDAADPDDGGGGVSAPVVIGLVATGAFAVGAGVTGGLALSKQSEFEDLRDTDRAAAEQVRDDGITLNVVTDVLLGSAVAAAAVTVVLLFTQDDAEDESTAPNESAACERDSRVKLAPVAGLDGAALFVVGTF